MATVKENIVNGIEWFYKKLTSRYLDPMITMLLTGKINGWLLDEDGNVIMSHDEDGLELSWKLYNQKMIADDYDVSLSYSVGDYCVYDDKLYKFVENKEPGEWDDTLVQKTTIVRELNNAVQELQTLSGGLQTLSKEVEVLEEEVSTYQNISPNSQPESDGDDDTKVSPGPEIIDPDDGDTDGDTDPDDDGDGEDGDDGNTGGTLEPEPGVVIPDGNEDDNDSDGDNENNDSDDDG